MTRPTEINIVTAYGRFESRDKTAANLREQGFKFNDAWFSQQLDAYYGKGRKVTEGPFTDEDWHKSVRALEALEAFDRALLSGGLTEADKEPIDPDTPHQCEDEDDADEEAPGVIESADKRRDTTVCKTLVFTSAQSNTKVHEAFLKSLEVFCRHRGAELHISRYTYNKSSFGKKSVKPGADTQEGEKLWFDPAISPYVSDVSIQLTTGLVWCGELNILPTMKFPLTQFKTYTRQDSAIIPHAKMAMESVPTMQGTPCKMLYTTGSVTQRNYVEKTAGQVADFHHVFGAVLVEIDAEGQWWARQLNATNDGSFYDLCEYFTPHGVLNGQRVEAITHGDIHWEKRDQSILDIVFGHGGIVDNLAPREQFFHDIVDFAARNHHNIKDGHFLHQMRVDGTDSVSNEFREAGEFLSTTAYRSWAETFIVTSNHDMAVEVWLRNPAGMTDSVNATFWHWLNHYCHTTIEEGRRSRPFAHALVACMSGPVMQNHTILHEDDSHLILGSIEAGLHGHLGPNGARGAPKNLRTVGKANTGHTHTAGIVEGVYTSGLYGKFDLGYNKGLSSWSHSLTVTYPNAKRSILTIRHGRAWR